MTAIRLIPFPIHAALRMATGLLTMAAPFLAGFDVAATLAAIVIGSLVVGISLAATPDERGRTSVPVSALQAMDWGTVLVLMGTAVAVAATNDRAAGVTLAAIALAQLAGNLTTRYSLRA